MKARDLMQRLNIRLVCNKVEDMEVKAIFNGKIHTISDDYGGVDVILDDGKDIITIKVNENDSI